MSENQLNIDGLRAEFEYYLDSLPTRVKLRGQILYEENKVGGVVFYPKEHLFRTKVTGTYPYEVVLKLGSNNRTIINGTCNCPYGETCKHQIALIYSLINGGNLRFSEDSDMVTSDKKSKRLKLEFDGKTESHIVKADSLTEILSGIYDLKPRNLKKVDPYYTKYRHFLVDDHKLESTLWLENWRTRKPDLKGKIDISFKENQIKVHCGECNFDEATLCSCSYNIMQESIRLAIHLGLDNLNYTQQIEEVADEYGVPSKTASTLFDIELTSDSKFVHPKASNVIYPDNLNVFKQLLETAENATDNKVLEVLESQMDFGEAFVWSSISGLRSRPPIFLLAGKLNSTRDKFVSSILNVEMPKYLSTSEVETFKYLASKLNFGYQPDGNNIENLKEVKGSTEIIQEALPSLKRSINYFYKPVNSTFGYGEEIRKRDIVVFNFAEELLSIRLTALKKDGLFVLQSEFYLGEVKIKIPSLEKINYYFIIIDNIAYLFEHAGLYDLILAMAGESEIKFLPSSQREFFDILLNLERQFEIVRDDSLQSVRKNLKNLNRLVSLKEVGDHIVFTPLFQNESGNFNALKPKPIFEGIDIVLPDIQDIEHFKAFILAQHPTFESYDGAESFVYLHRNGYIKNEWYLDFFEQCREHNVEILGRDEFERIKFSEFKAQITAEVSSDIDWFDLNINLVFGTEKVDRKKWLKAIKEGKSYIELKDGTLGVIPDEWFVKISKMVTLADLSQSGLRINKLRYNVIDELFDDIKDRQVLEDIREKRQLLENFDTSKKHKLPESINATLRPYQLDGYQWLRFLEECHFGGILADDMGLGKTLQIITLLAHAKKKRVCKALITVPKSLIFNWKRELDKFCPDLSYHVHHGPDRHQDIDAFNTSDIVISTYATVTKDIAQLSTMQFTHVVLDESQAIKNPQSKRFKAVRLLQAKFKLCMTGTPIQNNTFDLYSQASFSNPGLLGNQTYFKQNFAVPIDKEGDREASQLLIKLIHPFILRRTKEQVAQDLPDKTESVIYCDMYPHQRLMYNELKNRIRNDLMSLNEKDGKMKFMVLDGLLKLRQLCNAPLLVDPKLKGHDARSIKIDSLIYSLTEEIGEGNAIVFSQFVQMLSLVRKELDALGIPYAYLDGKTRNRAEEVDRFMNNPDCKIFLLSLKAGNTGLNLTKAQYVYIIDPWWNPAVEAQAIDRTHRIGQDKKVFAYKMICNDSVEQKIVTLQERKKKVAVDIIQTDESVFKSLNKKDLMALFD